MNSVFAFVLTLGVIVLSPVLILRLSWKIFQGFRDGMKTESDMSISVTLIREGDEI